MTDGLITEGRGDGGAQQSRLSKHKSFGWTSEDSHSLKTNSSQKAGTAHLYNIHLVNKFEDAVIFFSLISLKIWKKLDFEKRALIFPVLATSPFS